MFANIYLRFVRLCGEIADMPVYLHPSVGLKESEHISPNYKAMRADGAENVVSIYIPYTSIYIYVGGGKTRLKPVQDITPS